MPFITLGATNARVGELIGTILYLGFFFLHLSCSYSRGYLVIIFWLSTDETFNRNVF